MGVIACAELLVDRPGDQLYFSGENSDHIIVYSDIFNCHIIIIFLLRTGLRRLLGKFLGFISRGITGVLRLVPAVFLPRAKLRKEVCLVHIEICGGLVATTIQYELVAI